MTLPDSQKIEEGLREILLEAGAFAAVEFGKFSFSDVEYKGENDPFTYVDLTVERMLQTACEVLVPGAGFVNEETGKIEGNNEALWIIDPIDGTVNFTYGIPHFCISVALQISGELELGMIYAPMQGDMYSARRGHGAWLNGQPMQVSTRSSMNQALLATGFPYDRSGGLRPHFAVLREMLLRAQGVRRFGSAALDMAYVAAGRYDAFYEFSLHPWDVAAGILLIREAGGKVTDFDGEEDCVWQQNLVASNQLVHTQIMKVLEEVLPFN